MIDGLLQENTRLTRANTQMDGLIDQGTSILGTLRSQRMTLKVLLLPLLPLLPLLLCLTRVRGRGHTAACSTSSAPSACPIR